MGGGVTRQDAAPSPSAGRVPPRSPGVLVGLPSGHVPCVSCPPSRTPPTRSCSFLRLQDKLLPSFSSQELLLDETKRRPLGAFYWPQSMPVTGSHHCPRGTALTVGAPGPQHRLSKPRFPFFPGQGHSFSSTGDRRFHGILSRQFRNCQK